MGESNLATPKKKKKKEGSVYEEVERIADAIEEQKKIILEANSMLRVLQEDLEACIESFEEAGDSLDTALFELRSGIDSLSEHI